MSFMLGKGANEQIVIFRLTISLDISPLAVNLGGMAEMEGCINNVMGYTGVYY